MMFKRIALGLVCAAVAASCSKKPTETESASAGVEAKPAETKKSGADDAGKAASNKANAESAPTGSPKDAPREVVITVIEEGAGPEAKKGDTLIVHYTGTLENGTKFDSSLDRNKPFPVKLGAGRVIPGWEQGLIGMKKAEKRKLTIPAHLAYGARGAGATIPPHSTLIFEVELVELTPAADTRN